MFRTSWTRRIATFVTTATMAGFGLTSVASAQTITNTGPSSHNSITTHVTNDCSVRNTNNVSASNYNHQSATTGDANDSGNTTAGSWTGWATLDPAAAQASGASYSSWWNGVVTWMASHASGNGWNSDESNLTWAPSSTSWAEFNPMVWQANGQSFGNWYNGIEAYLNSNNGLWALSWPADATGTFGGGATTGSAINNNSANFSININNAARAAAGTNACGQSNFVPPTCTTCGGGGMGGGPSSAPVVFAPTTVTPKGGSGGGAGGGSYVGGGYSAPAMHPVSAPSHVSTPATSTTPSSGSGSSGGSGGGAGGGAPSTPVSSISNTGPGSNNTITSTYTSNASVTNTNCVTVVNTSTQSASSGNATASGNTYAGSGGSGDASNGNATGVGGAITN